MPRTREGYLWTPNGSTEGLETDAVVPSTVNLGEKSKYDVVVIGAGFAGLVAARDLCQYNSQLKVLIVEARDRIGGRTWTAKALGEEFEMGGTWVHWNQPHFYRELHRYNLHGNLKTSSGIAEPGTTYFQPSKGGIKEVDSEASGAMLEAIAKALFTIDGHTSRSLMPYPHDSNRTPSPWKDYDHLTIRQRLDQLTQFSDLEKEEFESQVASLGSAPCSEIGFVELLRWYALGGHTLAQMFELCGVYKLGKGGMTNLAKEIYNDYLGDIATKAVVKHIDQTSSSITIRLEDNKEIQCESLICTLPLNCLSDITFTPPLSPLRTRAAKIGQGNRGAKIHFTVSPPAQTPWFASFAPPSKFVFAFTDHNGTNTAPDAKPPATHAIAFTFNPPPTTTYSTSPAISASPDTVLPTLKSAFPLPSATTTETEEKPEITAYLTHPWHTDPYAKGVWACFGPNYTSTYLQELQKPHGKVFFASADTADGWRGFVDGAVERGSRAAGDVARLLRPRQQGVRARL